MKKIQYELRKRKNLLINIYNESNKKKKLKKNQINNFDIFLIPSEIWLLIFSFLNSKDLNQVIMVCSYWKKIIFLSPPLIWRKLKITKQDWDMDCLRFQRYRKLKKLHITTTFSHNNGMEIISRCCPLLLSLKLTTQIIRSSDLKHLGLRSSYLQTLYIEDASKITNAGIGYLTKVKKNFF